jgi:glycosyltransferase involved in cell wall biosynthesis
MIYIIRFQNMPVSTFGLQPPQVSAIIPLYNKRKTIERAIESVRLAGIHAPVEAVIVDDGSDDGSTEIAFHLADKYPWITLHVQENKGCPVARNKACALANTDILAFLDADDAWLPSHAKNMIAGFNSNPSISLVVDDWSRFTDDIEVERKTFDVRPGLIRNHFLSMAWGDNYAATSATACRRRHFEMFGGFHEDLRNGQDRALWGEAYLVGHVWFTGVKGAEWHNDTSNSLMSSAHQNRFPKYENWIEGRIEQIDGRGMFKEDVPGMILRQQMIENLVRDSEIIGSFAALNGVEWMRDERMECLVKWGRPDLADLIGGLTQGGKIPPRLSHR